jgi:PEP-CTERM motif
MHFILRGSIYSLRSFLGASIFASIATAAPTVWSGLTHSFTKPDGVDGTQSQFQDHITPNVYLARGYSQGLYNAATEPNYLDLTSPEFTAWATDLNNPTETIAATNYGALTFDPWATAYNHQVGDTIVGRSAVLYLVLDNIYLDIQFTSWANPHLGGQGGFSYLRAEPPGPSGDYNHNHFVDAADYTVWRDTLGQTGIPPGTGADGNANGMIDAGDYDFWKAHFGNPAPAAGGGAEAATAVPEPATILLALAALGTICLVANRRR